MAHDRHRGVQRHQPLSGRVDLGAPELGGRVQMLAVQVAELDDIIIDDADKAARSGTDACAHELGQHDTAEPASADHEHAGASECVLRIHSEAGQGQLTGVTSVVDHAAIVAVEGAAGLSGGIHQRNAGRVAQNRGMTCAARPTARGALA
jgi:hypothetical protein